MGLLVMSGSWAETDPTSAPTNAASDTIILLTGEENTGGSSMFSTWTQTKAVSL